MADKKIDIVISTILKKTGIEAASAAIKSLGKTVATNMMNVKAGFDLAKSGIATFVSAISKGMQFEQMAVGFKNLTGSLDSAKSHLKDLQELGKTPPFGLEEFAAASKEMMKMTEGLIGYKKEMQLVGDIAAATGSDLKSISHAVGLAYQSIKDGEGFGRAGSQLVQLGVLTKKQVEYFDQLSQSGTSNAAVWEELQRALSKYTGAMSETEKTTQGILESIKGEFDVALTTMSGAISESAKPELEGLLGVMRRISEDGTIEDWADKTVDSLTRVAEGAKAALAPLANIAGGIWNFIKGGWEATGQAAGNVVGTLAGGGSVKDALKAGLAGVKSGINDVYDLDGAQAQYDQDKREQRKAEKAKRRAEEQAKLEEARQRKAQEAFAKAQEEIDRKNAEKKAQEAQKAEDLRLKQVETEQKAREKMEAALHSQRLQNLKDELATSEKLVSEKSSVVSSAQSEFDRAFAMYRDPESAKRQIEEERSYAADYKRLQKDASRYGGKWRIDTLASLMAAGDTQGQRAQLEEWRKSKSFTPEIEAMVRASAADQSKTTAEDELRKINHNTEALANKLDELLKIK